MLSVSTIFLFATQLSERFGIDWTIWPPRPSTVFACLPLVRNSYKWIYKKAFGNLNRKWIQKIQPRQAQDSNEGERNEADAAAVADEIADGDVMLELNLEIGVGGDKQEEAQEDRRPQQQGGGQAQQGNNDNFAAPPAAAEAANNNADNNPPENADTNANQNQNQNQN